MPRKAGLAIFVSAFVVGLSGALMPGPLLTLDITEAARQGFWAGPTLVLGHAVAELLAVALLVKGLGRFIRRWYVIGGIGVVGGGFLLWMGGAIFTTTWTSPLSGIGADLSPASPFWVLAGSGALVSVTNPYWLLWWATIGTGYVVMSLRQGIAGVGSFYAGHILSDLLWYSVVAFIIASGRNFLTDSVYQVVLLVCGVALVGLGAYFVFSGVRFLWRRKAVVAGESEEER
ncbi:MAG: LysE family transporter [Dehalococcoidia bacterium]|nr:LysE family transporter [Dehalococcoidia bacterium]